MKNFGRQQLFALYGWLTLLGCSSGTRHPYDYLAKGGGTGGAPVGSISPLDGDAAAEAPFDLCANPKAVNEPYRGTHLTGMGMQAYGWDKGYSESDFATLSDLGFNWVRLTLDYLNYTEPGDWSLFDSAGLEKIDEAVVWGCKYGVHVCLNLYQAPGYSVATAVDPSGLNLWKDPAAQTAFASHWQMFARRYAQVPASNLSFNLVNEPPAPPSSSNPSGVLETAYLGVMRQAIRLIRDASPDRPILVDGLNFGRTPLSTFTDTTIIQSLHDYDPIQVTHFKAPWMQGSSTWTEPTWPPFMAPRYLFGPVHTDVTGTGPGKDYCQQTSNGNCAPLTLVASFPAGTVVSVKIRQVSYSDATVANAAPTRLEIYADNVATPLLEQEYSAQRYPADQPPCNDICANSAYHVLQPVLNQDYQLTLAADVQSLSFQATSGDWLELSEIDVQYPTIAGAASLRLVPAISRWDVPQASFTINSSGQAALSGNPPPGYEADFNSMGWLDVWKNLRQSGITVMVGEFGVYNQTSQEVTLEWYQDQLNAFQHDGFSGWATWDIYSEFGVLGPPRPGETPETYAGHPLNRALLNLLMQH